MINWLELGTSKHVFWRCIISKFSLDHNAFFLLAGVLRSRPSRKRQCRSNQSLYREIIYSFTSAIFKVNLWRAIQWCGPIIIVMVLAKGESEHYKPSLYNLWLALCDSSSAENTFVCSQQWGRYVGLLSSGATKIAQFSVYSNKPLCEARTHDTFVETLGVLMINLKFELSVSMGYQNG